VFHFHVETQNYSRLKGAISNGVLTKYSPIKAFWTYPPISNSHCISDAKITFGGGVIKLFTDIVITTLPLPLISRLNISRRQKHGVLILLAFGYLVVIAGAVRLYETGYIFWRTWDLTWYEYVSFMASVIENNLAVVCLAFNYPLLDS
jgi:rhodopsin domain-containing protein